MSSSESQEATFSWFVYAICRSVQHVHSCTLQLCRAIKLRDKNCRRDIGLSLQRATGGCVIVPSLHFA